MPEEQQGQGENNGTQGSGSPGAPPAPAPRPAADLDWRARALKAEARAQELEKLAAELARKLELAAAQHAAAERARQVEKALADHGAVDVETASLLLERTLAAAPSDDVPGAVAELRRRKPFLFGASPRASAMSAAAPSSPDTLATLADEARATGDRGALLRYLRHKRG